MIRMTKNENAPNMGDVCMHEDRIAHHEAQLSQLETKADYKEKRLDSLERKIEKIINTVDELNDNLNKYLLQSNAYDKDLELRLKAIETELTLTKEIANTNRKDTNLKIAIVTLIFLALTFYFNYIHHLP